MGNVFLSPKEIDILNGVVRHELGLITEGELKDIILRTGAKSWEGGLSPLLKVFEEAKPSVGADYKFWKRYSSRKAAEAEKERLQKEGKDAIALPLPGYPGHNFDVYIRQTYGKPQMTKRR